MKIKKIALSLASVALLAMPSYILADDDIDADDEYEFPIDISGELIGNYSIFTHDGETHNPEQNLNGTNKRHNIGSQRVAEVKAKLYLDQDVTDNVSWHGELDFNKDWAAIDGYRDTRINSQFDWLRELYTDIAVGDNLSLRLGKQTVVWGKADGVKFLDVINPTDFRHWGQDKMEDSTIPLWMINAEYAINDNSSFQMIYVPQVNVTNQIPGLYNPQTGDAGQEFVPLGMDTMLGKTNGFKNIGPEMGMVAGAFTQGFSQLLPNMANPNILAGFTNLTVAGFTGFDGSDPAGGHPDVDQFLQSTIPMGSGYTPGSVPSGVTGNMMLSGVIHNNPTNPPAQGGPGIGAKTNLMGASLNTANPTTMFDYMGDTTFATFDAFVGMKTKYVRDHADNKALEGNLGFKYANSIDEIGLNFTLNYYYHYDNNPVINVSWAAANGAALASKATVGAFDAHGRPVGSPGAGAEAYKTTTMSLVKGDGTAYNYATNGPATMVFTEKQNRINTFGASFDYAIDNSFAPIIIRSEMVYDKGTLQPVVDLGKLAYGDLAGAFTNQKADFFNYVIGADMTVMTNLFMSFQFMDKWNLDYVDEGVQYAGNTRQYSKHTANAATMSLGNGFKKAEEHQIMYTFFLSKPFLESDALRVNNITLLENDNYGWWDRLDFEYTYTDDILLTGALNVYGGDDYGVFGQFKNSSNVQLGFKYIF